MISVATSRTARRSIAALALAAAWNLTAAFSACAAAPGAAAPAGPDTTALRATVVALADTSDGGRPIGSAGIERAADLIIRSFRSSGLTPPFDGEYVQPFTGAGATIENIAGLVEGRVRPGQVVVLGAHYDGLPRDDRGRARGGADDNASGVAIVLEAARLAASERPPDRSLLFITFTGEESGLLGSREYVRHPAVPLDSTVAMLNLDTVGRLVNDKLTVFGVGTAEQFSAMLDGLNLSAGFDLEKIQEDSGSSDQTPFYAQGVPVLHFFTGPKADYHRAGDTAEKVNPDGMARITSFVLEAMEYLARRPEPLTFRMVGSERAAGEQRTERRVTLGVVPDFGYSGQGVLLTAALPGSPAQRAGLEPGDVVIEVGGDTVDNLADLQAVLTSHKPGDYVTVVYRRGTETRRVDITLAERH